MDFSLGSEQLALASAVHELCRDRLRLDQIRDREDRPADAGVWQGIADLGVFGILTDGGQTAHAVEAAIAVEALGVALAPGPVIWSMLAASLVDGVADGRVRATGVDDPVAPVVMPHARESETALVLFTDRVETVSTTTGCGELADGTSLDPTTPVAILPCVPDGEVLGGRDLADRIRTMGTVLTAAALVGVAQGALDVTRSYVLTREQFGRPVGAFQAVKHLLADMFVRVELARSETYAAAALVADRGAASGDVVRAAWAAKLLAGEAGVANGRSAVQLHGGMGFTWEMLPHYYLKRAWVLEHSFGTSDRHALALATAIEG